MGQDRSQVRIYGVGVQDTHARKLVGQLNKAGTPASLAAAHRISGALDRRDSAGQLTPDQRDAILAALRPAPQGTKELYRALLRDQGARRDN